MRETNYEYAELWHNVPGSLEKAGGLWLVRAGRNRAKPHYTAGPKRIEAYGVHAVIEGSLVLVDEDRQMELHQGDVFCLFPGISYTYRKAVPEGALRMVWLTFDGPQMEALLAALGITRDKPYRLKALHQQARRTLRQIEQSLWEPGPARLLARTGLLYRWLDELASNRMDIGEWRAEGAERTTDWLGKAVAFFRLHYAEPHLRVEAVARLAGIHRSHFTQTFAERVGMSPQRFVAELRMEKARELLTAPMPGIGEIALSVGYPDLYSFSRAFKKRFGMSPSEYRGRKMSIVGGGSDTL